MSTATIMGHHFVGHPAVCRQCHLSLEELKLFFGTCGNLVAIPVAPAALPPPNMEALEKALRPFGLHILSADVTHRGPRDYSIRIEAMGITPPPLKMEAKIEAAEKRFSDSLVDAADYLHRAPDPGTKMVGLDAFLTAAETETLAARHAAVAATGWRPRPGTPEAEIPYTEAWYIKYRTKQAEVFPRIPVAKPGYTLGSDPPVLNSNTAPGCECGAQRLGHARGSVGHSRWCPWSQG